MHDRKHSEQIERMLDVMLCMPKSAWGLVLERVEKKIGAAVLRRIILRAYEESDLKRGIAILDREKKRTEAIKAISSPNSKQGSQAEQSATEQRNCRAAIGYTHYGRSSHSTARSLSSTFERS